MRSKDGVNLVTKRIFAAAGEFAIRKSTSAAFTKLHIAEKIQRAILPEAVHLRRAFRHRLPLLQQERCIAMFCQCIGGKQSCWTCTHNNRAPI